MQISEYKEKWSHLCKTRTDIPTYLHPWWWDITSGKGKWEVILSESKKGTVEGAMLVAKKKSFGVKRLTIPVFTPNNGVWLAKQETDKVHSLYSKRRKIITRIIKQIPKASLYDFKINYEIDDWLPFKWAGFKQTSQYTQILDLRKTEDELFSAFKSATRTKILRSQESLKLVEVDKIDKFLDHVNRVHMFKSIPLSDHQLQIIRSLDAEIRKRDLGIILAVQDKEGRTQAMIYILFSSGKAHYWLGGADPDFRNSNGMFLLLWEAIKYSKKKANIFDFDGSNHPRIAPVFTGFGAIPKANHYIYKSSNLFFRILRQIINKDGG